MEKNFEIHAVRDIIFNGNLKPSEKLTLIYLLDKCLLFGAVADSDCLLGTYLGISERTTSSCIKKLKELNFIIVTIERNKKYNKRIINLNYEELEKRIEDAKRYN